MTFSAHNENWHIRLNTSRVCADIIPARAIDYSQSAARDAFCNYTQAWAAKGYVTEDAAVLAVFQQTCAESGILNFLTDGLLRTEHFPQLVDALDAAPLRFATMRHPRPGVYPIVDTLDHLSALLDAGAQIIQLRVKSDQLTPELRQTITQAVKLAQRYPESQLFVNDYWQAAIDAGAYGVHLGQEDLLTADLCALQRAGLRLGVSSHAFWEVARAFTIRPSYIACGPVFPTRAKAMPWIAQGLDNLRYWVGLLPFPVVGIGGVNTGNLQSIHDTGCASASIIQAIVSAGNPAKAYQDLQSMWVSFAPPRSSEITLARPTLAA